MLPACQQTTPPLMDIEAQRQVACYLYPQTPLQPSRTPTPGA
jgi:hypothetical protein